jgi:hypothetical protein
MDEWSQDSGGGPLDEPQVCNDVTDYPFTPLSK